MEKFFPSNKIKVTGNPIRSNIAQNSIPKNDALSFFDLNSNKKTLLVIGGSLGAKSINDAIAKDINKFTENNIQLIWQTGKNNAADYIKFQTDGIWISAFIEKMEMAYAAADVVISRAGAMSVAEICVVNKPAVFVPYPYAAEDHQTVNAQHLVQKNAAILVKDINASKDLVNTSISLLNNQELQNSIKTQIAPLAITNADEAIATHILNYLNGR
jgi:UDP-N-acetylglucosamine--N-acetylmuramyl-(pentapeptide) pyrophosphoryl-undecaprenol N-acetylglucosamine transferase